MMEGKREEKTVIPGEETLPLFEKDFMPPHPSIVRMQAQWDSAQEVAREFLECLRGLTYALSNMNRLADELRQAVDTPDGFQPLLEDMDGPCLSGLEKPTCEDVEAMQRFALKVWTILDRLRREHPSLGLPDPQVPFRLLSGDLARLPWALHQEFERIVRGFFGEDSADGPGEIPVPEGGLRGPYKDYFVNHQSYYLFELEEAYKAHGWERVPRRAARRAKKVR